LLEDVGIRVMVLNAYYKTDRTVTRQCYHNFTLEQGRIQIISKLWVHKVILSNLHKIGKYSKEIGGKVEENYQKSEELSQSQYWHCQSKEIHCLCFVWSDLRLLKFQ